MTTVATQSKITVIGGAGFVGTNFCQQLTEMQIPFEIIDIQKSQVFPEQCKTGDVRDIDSLRKTITGNTIVNLAAVHRDDVHDISEYHKTNVDGAKNISAVCLEKNIKKIVFISSVAVYGFGDEGADEKAPINPFNEYGKTKYSAEEVFRDWQLKKDNKLTIIRPAVVFGEGNRGNVYNLLNQINSGAFAMIGNGLNKKSMAYVKNLSAFLVKCIDSDEKYAAYNYVDTPDFTMNELVSLVRGKLKGNPSVGVRIPKFIGLMVGYMADGLYQLGVKLPISSIRVKKFCASSEYSSAKGELDNFVAPYCLQEALNRTLEAEFINPDPNRPIFYTE